MSTRRVSRSPGRWRGRVTLADDFDETPSDLIEDFEASGPSASSGPVAPTG